MHRAILSSSGGLEDKLRVNFLRDPQVTVRISEASVQRMTVEDTVEKPGMFRVRGGLTLLQAIALPGGPSRGADPSKVLIFRTTGASALPAALTFSSSRRAG